MHARWAQKAYATLHFCHGSRWDKFTIGGGQCQSVTICHRLPPFLLQPLFEFVPVLTCMNALMPRGHGCASAVTRGLIIRLRQHLNNIDHRKPPGYRHFVTDAAEVMGFEQCHLGFHSTALQKFLCTTPPAPKREAPPTLLNNFPAPSPAVF